MNNWSRLQKLTAFFTPSAPASDNPFQFVVTERSTPSPDRVCHSWPPWYSCTDRSHLEIESLILIICKGVWKKCHQRERRFYFGYLPGACARYTRIPCIEHRALPLLSGWHCFPQFDLYLFGRNCIQQLYYMLVSWHKCTLLVKVADIWRATADCTMGTDLALRN